MRTPRSPAGQASGPREVAGEEPVGGPLAEPAQRGERALTSSSGSAASASRSRSLRARPTTYSALRREKPSAKSSSSLGGGEPLARREGVGVLGPHAEALDQPVADREGAKQRDLLRGDRGDEALERARPRAAAAGRASSAASGAEHRVARGEARRRRRGRTRRPSSLRTTGSISASSGSTSTPPGAAVDPHLAPADDAVQPALVPEVREVGPERAVALGRELEVVRLGDAQERHVPDASDGRAARRTARGSREGLERHAPLGEVLGEPAGREDPIGREGGAAIRVAVADVDDVRRRGRSVRLQDSPHSVAVVRVAPVRRASRPAAGRRGSRAARPRRLRARAPARSARGSRSRRRATSQPSRVRARRTPRTRAGRVACSSTQRDALLERRRDRRELARDHVAERKPALVEAVLDLLRTPSGRRTRARPRGAVRLGHGAVEVENDRLAHWHAFVTVPSPMRANFLITMKTGGGGQRLRTGPVRPCPRRLRGATSLRPDPGRTCASRPAPRTTSRRTCRRRAPCASFVSFSGWNVSHMTASSCVSVAPIDFSARPGCGPCGIPDGCSVTEPTSIPFRDENWPST